ncbi:anhydro-N-acetylmuramic acid kinase, partial [Candidatus Bipolaricaulota bacterium]|nr:anhydro-N-acetylmuramic acid kinase [Candidatus Bipolaricaulota bacterium]
MKIIGLMSGTSMDGITAALTDIEFMDDEPVVELLQYETFPYPEDLKTRLMNLVKGGNVKELCEINFKIGEQFAKAAKELMEGTEEKVELIGSHGQTVCHLPAVEDENETYTLQIGEPDLIAEETEVTTIADFRTRDVAAGGGGAPLIPYMDYRLFRSNQENRLALNLGGIANVTYLPKRGTIDDLIAFDTGPGNMVLDQLVRNYTHGEKEYDEDGRWANRGTINEDLLDMLMEHPFTSREPPKSTGRQGFGKEFADEVELAGDKLGLSREDVLATVTGFTAETVKRSCYKYLGEIDRVIASGGGTENSTLMEELRNRLSAKVVTTKEFGIP